MRPSIRCPWCAMEFPDEEQFGAHTATLHAHLFGKAANAARQAQNDGEERRLQAAKRQEQARDAGATVD